MRLYRLDCLRPTRPTAGFSVVEVALITTVILIMAAVSVPLVQGVMRDYRFRNAVSATVAAIQGTRFQAIMRGAPHAIEFDPATSTYQLYRQPVAGGAFVPVGNPLPIQGAVFSARTRLVCQPNGMVAAAVGSLSLELTHGDASKQIIVSRFGNVHVEP